MPFPVLGSNSAVAGYEIDNSLRFGGDDHHLSMIYSSAASNLKTWTFSGWIKLGQAAHFSQNYPNEKFILTSSDAAVSTTSIGYGGYTSGNAGGFHLNDGRSGTYIETTSKFRDPSAWYHLVVRYDSTQIIASDRIFIYVNGESQSLNYSNTGDPEVDLNTEVDFFRAGTNIDATSGSSGNFIHNINSYFNSGYDAIANSFDGYIADFYLINAQSLAPTEFGETNENGVWIPKKYGGTFNSHSFKLEFKQTGSSADASGMGADTSGQNNHFKIGINSTLDATDQTIDTPTNNFCTFNPLDNAVLTLSEGNTKATHSSVSGGEENRATLGAANGKWYFEFQIQHTVGSTNPFAVGMMSNTGRNPLESDLKTTEAFTSAWHSDASSNRIESRVSGSATLLNCNLSYPDNGDIINVAMDLDNGRVFFGKNGTYIQDALSNTGNPSTGANPPVSFTTGGHFYFPAIHNRGSQGLTVSLNTGNPSFSISSGNSDANGYGNFEYAVPSGYYSLCTKNLAEYG
jgi:hypothetical protein